MKDAAVQMQTISRHINGNIEEHSMKHWGTSKRVNNSLTCQSVHKENLCGSDSLMKLSVQDTPEESSLLERELPSTQNPNFSKFLSLFIIGVITFIYSVAEIVIAIYLHSLALLTDGFHNFSDVIAIGIAYWAIRQSTVTRSETMTFGWKRTEVLGAVMNGCFLLALCLYIVLESIPRFISPDESEATSQGSWEYIAIAASGLAVNLFGTLVFAVTGHGHTHGPGEDHGHSHGEHAHAKKKKTKTPETEPILPFADEHHGHSHGEKKAKKEGHGHAHEGKKEKKPHVSVDLESAISHAHSTDEKREVGHGHSHSYQRESEAGECHDDHESHSDAEQQRHSHSGQKKKVEKSGHSHSHSAGKSPKEEKHAHAHAHEAVEEEDAVRTCFPCLAWFDTEGKFDLNIRAVLLHYLGDALSSFCLVIAGLLLHFFPYNKKDGSNLWTLYIDPLSSLIIVGIIIVTLVPLLKNCSYILLHQVPAEIDANELTEKLKKVNGIEGVHDLHVWKLDDTMIIASVHVSILVSSIQFFGQIASHAKSILHDAGIHSSTIQPEFIQSLQDSTKCESNCAVDCEEDWCCKDEQFEGTIINYS